MARRSSRTTARSPTAARRRGRRHAGRRFLGRPTAVLLRWSMLAAAGFVAFLYYQPLSSYIETRSTLNERSAEVRQLRQERIRLQARLEHSATVQALSREARRMGLVRPGERLFIVKGVQEWRRAHLSDGAR